MFQYYFRVYKRNNEFKSRKSIESLHEFYKFSIFIKKNFFKKNMHSQLYIRNFVNIIYEF